MAWQEIAVAYTQTQIDKLKTAIASGVLEVQHGDERIRYRSLDEMRAILETMERSVNSRARRTVAKYQSSF